MKIPEQIRARLITTGPIILGLTMLMVIPAWPQADDTPSQQPAPASVGVDNSQAPDNSNNNGNGGGDDRMQTPPPVSGQAYPIAFTSEERSNYLRAGVVFTGAYSDNALAALESHPVSDISYSVAPIVALDESTARQHLTLTYAPGFTFYQRTSSLNGADQTASIDFDYRLSPHVTFSARDDFQKSSSLFNQPNLTSTGGVSGGAVGANSSVIAPLADLLVNSGSVGLTYQFSLNDMIGASGSFSYLHYPNPAQVPGLSDSNSQAGLAFYSHRISRMHYLGLTYQYQRLLSYPTAGQNETQTHAALVFYTVYPTSRFSISFFGGSQHLDTVQPFPLLPLRQWTPEGGASLSWQGRLNSFAVDYLHVVSGGGGLVGAAQVDGATASLRQQITKTLSGSAAGGYTRNNVLGAPVAGVTNGHSISATASLQQPLGQHVTLQLGYTRLHQSYSNVAVFAANPDTNREFVSLSYQFVRPLGR